MGTGKALKRELATAERVYFSHREKLLKFFSGQ